MGHKKFSTIALIGTLIAMLISVFAIIAEFRNPDPSEISFALFLASILTFLVAAGSAVFWAIRIKRAKQ